MSESPTPRGDVHLNDNQRRHYVLLLARLEQSLDQIDRATRGEPAPSQLTRPLDDLPARFVAQSPPMIASVRTLLADIVTSLGLQPREISRRRTCQALITSELVGVENSYASQLRGYGTIDPSVAERLDPELRRVHAGLAQLGALLRDTSEPGAA